MTYAKKVWKDGETITKEALNNLERGVSANDTAIQQFSQKIGAISGIAPLDSSGKVPKANIPEIFPKPTELTSIMPNSNCTISGGYVQYGNIVFVTAQVYLSAALQANMWSLMATGLPGNVRDTQFFALDNNLKLVQFSINKNGTLNFYPSAANVSGGFVHLSATYIKQ